jgi:PAS domain S-box-containing protein
MSADISSVQSPPEAAVAGSSDLFRHFVEGVREYAIFLLSPDGIVMTWNEGAKAIKGYEKEEIVGRHFSRFYLPEAVQNGWPMRELELAAQAGRFVDEGWRVKKDGTSFWASVSISAVHDVSGTLIGFVKVTRDLTDVRASEERIQELNKQLRMRVDELAASQRAVELRTMELQRLSGQLLRAQDAERRRIARELHDELGQQLSALHITLNNIQQNQEDASLTEAKELNEAAIRTVRNLSYLLHPPLLDEAGLTPALHWYVEGLAKRQGLQATLRLQPASFPRLSNEIETTIFRIVQEGLTNVYRHAESASARVEIEKQGDIVFVRVRDYGKGLPTNILNGDLKSHSLGVGLGGMRERVRQFDGELRISREEPGTKIEARIPLYGQLPGWSHP